MTIDLKKEQRKVTKNLETIFNAPSMVSVLLQTNMQSVVEKQLNILSYLEKVNKSKTLTSTKLLEKYNTLAKKNYVIHKNLSYDDNDTLIDDINYLNVYIRNMYKIDVEALAQGKEAKILTPTVNEAQPTNTTPAAPFMMPWMAAGAMGGAQNATNPMIQMMASARVQQEANQGKVYLYKTKPKLIFVLRWVVSVCLILASISSIFIGIGMVTSAGASKLNSLSLFGGDSSVLTSESSLYFIFGIFLLFFTYSNCKPLLFYKTSKANDNLLYHFNFQQFIFAGLMFVFVLIFGLLQDNYVFWQQASPVGAPDHAFGLWAAFLGYTFMLSFIGIIIIAVGVAIYFNPKVDSERLQALTKQYAEEALKSPPPVPPGFPGT